MGAVGRQFAAETAEASSLADGRAFYADVKGRMVAIGRDPDHLKILPAAFVVVGDTAEEATAKARTWTASSAKSAASARSRAR